MEGRGRRSKERRRLGRKVWKWRERRSKERRRLYRKVWKEGGEGVKKEGDWVGRCRRKGEKRRKYKY